MFHYYRFITHSFREYREAIEKQAEKDKLSLRVIRDHNGDEDPDRVTVVVKEDKILDIYRG